jgi:hypothetical protein
MKSKIKKFLLCFPPLLLTLVISGFCIDVAGQNKSNSEPFITISSDNGWGSGYRAKIYSDGIVIYEGRNHSISIKRKYRISKAKVKELAAEFERINYFSLQDSYESNIKDHVSTTTSFLLNGKRKEIYNEWGPEELRQLQRKIIEVAGFRKFFDLQLRLAIFFGYLNADSKAKGLITNYGTKMNVDKREEDITKEVIIGRYDLNRFDFVRHIGNKAIKTEFLIIKPDGKKIQF